MGASSHPAGGTTEPTCWFRRWRRAATSWLALDPVPARGASSHDPDHRDLVGPHAGRLLVRPALPVGVDVLALAARGAEGPADRAVLPRDEPRLPELRQGHQRGLPEDARAGVGPGPRRDRRGSAAW